MAAKRDFGAEVVAPDDIYGITADVLSPCAFGAGLNDDTLKELRVSVVAGGANNQLARSRHGDALRARNILYAPDYVINGGGLIQLDVGHAGYDAAAVDRRVRGIARTLTDTFRRADQAKIPTSMAADQLLRSGCGPRGDDNVCYRQSIRC